MRIRYFCPPRPFRQARNRHRTAIVTIANKPFRTPFILSLALFTALSIGLNRPAGAEAMLLIEADSGKVLHAENATHPWYPASVTKLMTAYVTLRAVKEGRLSLDSLLTVSANAAAQAPSKMGFKPGTQLTVDNALKMLMVKSANDVAVVLAEGVSGSIEKFADDMNRAAQRLGMTQTTYVNPNGLPADGQVTSARDQAILARAILKEFPEYELYWRLPAIKLGKRVMRNYNTLIDRYPGADGMKTGFICASGFNLVASATRNGRRLIAVVFGAPSGPVRAVKAAAMLERGFNSGSLSWLTPSLGSVESLVPVNAPPPDLRESMCGKHRKRPAAESEDADDDSAQVNASNVTGDPSSAHGFTLSTLRATVAKPSSLIGPLQPSMEPVVVYVGPSKNKDQPDTQLAGSRKRKGTPVDAAAAIAAVPGAPRSGQPQVNVPAFAPTVPNYPSTATFTPPPGAPGYGAQSVPMPKPRPRLAARPAGPAAAAKPQQTTPSRPTVAKPAAHAAPTAKPAAQAATTAKPAAKPKPQ
jgi:D-alanyl-D-alanine carboxypeptidase